MVRTIARRSLLIVSGAAAALVCAEIALRVAGFSFRTYPTVQFGWPEPSNIRELFDPDPDLFWVTRGYADELNAARGAHPAIVFMGDSCTQFGTYPTMTLNRLRTHHFPAASGIKLGVAGWSSEQGLAQLQRDIIPLHPNVVTVYFGWNDHWVALGPEDADAHATRASFWLSQHSRLWQLLTKARLAAAPRLAGRPNRVPLDRYVANLETMVQLSNAAGIRVVLITAPTNHERGQEPEYLAKRHVRTLSDLGPLHQAYVEATRRAGRETGAVVCDAAAAFDADPDRRFYFEQDGIHLKVPGNRALADLLAPCVMQAAAQSILQTKR
jgi:lysophospholipase L1-like esterase